MKILVLNSGSSSLKYQLINSETEDVLAKGIAERIGVVGGKGRIKHELSLNGFHEVNVDMEDHDSAMDQVFMLLTCPDRGALKSVSEISAVGHRVVHGGEKFAKPVLVDDKIIAEIDKMSELAPLHNPPNLKGINACKRIMPNVPQVAVFDTAFHATMPDYAYTYALPYEYYMDFGVRRYGFHGTSHQYVGNIAMKLLAEKGIDRDESRIITCHLGNGCSITAIHGGEVIDTSMGLTPAEGLVMGTRAGDMDPAILLFLQRELECDSKELDNIINKKSGLLGVSGISSDMRDIEAAADRGAKRAQLALSIFCYRIKKYIGAYAAVMGGVDAIVFTGGIGENSPYVRAQSVCGLEFLGAKLDMAINADAKGLTELNESDSAVRIYIIPTNEEVMIARQTAEIINS